MRSPNPLVAIGISTLVVVGAVCSESAQASTSNSPEAASSQVAPSPQNKLDQPETSQIDSPLDSTSLKEAPSAKSSAKSAAKNSAVVVPTTGVGTAETAAIETPVSETPAPEDLAIEAIDSPASPASDASTAQSIPAETPATGTPGTDTAASGSSASNAVPQPAPLETPDDNTRTEPSLEAQSDVQPEVQSDIQSDVQSTDTPPTPSVTPPEATPSIAPSTRRRVEVPDYLNPSPNPLDFPTRPEEVQLQGVQPVTLRQAVDLAIRNNSQLRQVRQQLDQAQAQLDQARAANNPTVSVNANLAQAGQESAVPLTQPAFTVNNRGQVVPNPNAGETSTDIRSSDAATLSGNLEVNYALFTSGRRSSLIQAAEGQVRVQQLEIERQTNDLILQVGTAYFDLQQAGAQVRIFQSNVTQAEQSLRDAEALERAGVGTRFDVLQAQVDVANAQQQLTQQLSAFDISRRNLSQLLNASNSVDLTAADPIQVAGDWDLSLEQSIVEAFKNRAELEQQLVQRESAEQQRRAALAQLGPQVNLQGTLGVSNNLDAGNGFLSSYQLGVGVSLNVFDGGSARAQARAQETQVAQAESQFETLQSQIRFQTEQAYSQLQASATNIRTTELAVQQAAEALRLARLRFQAGVGTQTDVLRQQTVLAQSQVNNLQAILGYNRALLTLQRQVSNLPEGFLNDTP